MSLLSDWTSALFPTQREYEQLLLNSHAAAANEQQLQVLDPMFEKLLQLLQPASTATTSTEGTGSSREIASALAYECNLECMQLVVSLKLTKGAGQLKRNEETVTAIRDSLIPLSSSSFGTWKTCAVVGSAGQLLLDSFGNVSFCICVIVSARGIPTDDSIIQHSMACTCTFRRLMGTMQ